MALGPRLCPCMMECVFAVSVSKLLFSLLDLGAFVLIESLLPFRCLRGCHDWGMCHGAPRQAPVLPRGQEVGRRRPTRAGLRHRRNSLRELAVAGRARAPCAP